MALGSDLAFSSLFPAFRYVSVDAFCDRIVRQLPFALARYGDGKWKAVLGTHGKNCDGHPYSSELMVDLRSALRDGVRHPSNFYGMQNLAWRLFQEQIPAFFKEHAPDAGRLTWCEADVFHRASSQNCLHRYWQSLAYLKTLVFVGPEHLKLDHLLKRESVYDPKQEILYVRVPSVNCHSAHEDVIRQIRQILDKRSYPVFVSFSASMSANVMVHKLVRAYAGDNPSPDFVFPHFFLTWVRCTTLTAVSNLADTMRLF